MVGRPIGVIAVVESMGTEGRSKALEDIRTDKEDNR